MEQIKYVIGFLLSYDMEKVLLRKEKENEQQWWKGKWNGIGGKIIPPDYSGCEDEMEMSLREFQKEKPFQAMVREFKEETGIYIAPNRWHCFHIKEFNDAKIYYFVAFGDEVNQIRITTSPFTETGNVVHMQSDFTWNSWKEYIYDLRYILDMIRSETHSGKLMFLNPEKVNNDK